MEVSRSEPHSPASTGADEPARRPRVAKAVGVVVTVAWFVVCLFYIQRCVGWSNLLELLPVRIGARQMGPQRTPLASRAIDQERDRVGEQAGWAGGHQDGERVSFDQGVLDVEAVFAKERRLVHASPIAGCVPAVHACPRSSQRGA